MNNQRRRIDRSIKAPNKWRDWIISTLVIAKEFHKSTRFYFSYNQIIKKHGKWNLSLSICVFNNEIINMKNVYFFTNGVKKMIDMIYKKGWA